MTSSMTNLPKIILRQFSCLTVLLLIWSASLSCGQTPVEQGTVLKRITADWGVQFRDWEASADPCVGNWSGVTCDTQTKSRVTHLNFSGQGLRGPIPNTIGELVYLEGLDLQSNSVTDPVPVEIGKLVYLKDLNLSSNNFTSPPPDSLLKCTVLETLLMKRNGITGQLPLWIGELVTLRTLDFSQNKMWGGLPLEFGNLRNLVNMYLWENELSGFLPVEWSGLVNLEILQMGHNYLTGNVPNWLSELPKVRDVVFSRNQFYGPAPNLTKLIVNGNFTSAINRWLFDCNYLEGDWPTFNVPTVQLKYFSNCWNNETDGCATIGCSKNTTQDTPSNCSRTYNCPNFFEERKASQFIECAPCPPSQFITDGTRCVCGKDHVSDKVSKIPVGAVIGGVVGGIVVIIFAAILILLIYGKKRALKYPQFGRKYEGIGDPWTIPKELDRFTLQELERATNNFSEECFIGEGGFGKVYRGVLPDGKVVAIKCASNEGAQGQTEFRNELSLLSRLHHRHLCALEGFCDEDGLQLLVFEFMVNGDLHRNLFGKSSLNAAQRFEVAVGIARGLDYLHSFANPPVIHRDIKPSNILLDEYNVAKLADFGISKVTPELHTHISTKPVGTIGYIDPDYFRTNQLTVASDVFAFGIVLLELVTGQRVFDTSRLNSINLTDWVIPKFKQGSIYAIIDPRLGDNYDASLYTNLTEVGLMCSKIDRNDRPTMKEVLTILEPYARKALKDNSSALNPKWSTEYFRNKSLVEDSRHFAPFMNCKPYNSGESSSNSHDTSCFSSEPYDESTALNSGFDFEAAFRAIL